MSDSGIILVPDVVTNCFSELMDLTTEQQLRSALCELKLRFDACPSTYTKFDYGQLILTFASSLTKLYRDSAGETEDVIHFKGIAEVETNPEEDRIADGHKFPSIYLIDKTGDYDYFGFRIDAFDLDGSVVLAKPVIINGAFTGYETIVYKINGSGSGGGGSLITEDIQVILTDGKTVGKYKNGQTIPSAGKTATAVFKMIAQEAIPPTCTLGFAPGQVITQPAYMAPTVTNNIRFTYAVNTQSNPTNGLESYRLRTKRASDANWTDVSGQVSHTVSNTATGYGTFVHLIEENTTSENIMYDLLITDQAGQTITSSFVVTFKSYVTEPLSIVANKYVSERGVLDSPILTINLTQTNPSLPIKTLTLWRSINGAGYVALNNIAVTQTTGIFTRTIEDTLPNNHVHTIAYKVIGINALNNTVSSSIITVKRYYPSFLGYSTLTTLNQAQILALGNRAPAVTGHVREFHGVTAEFFNFTYYVYPGTTEVTNIMQDVATTQFGAFKRLPNINLTIDGQIVVYSVYKSNADRAFTNNQLNFL